MGSVPGSVHTGRPLARSPRHMWRVNQMAHRFTDRRKRAAQHAARGRSYRGGHDG